MVGLSVILENYREVFAKRSNNPQVIFKGSMIKPPSSPTDHYISPNTNLCSDSWFLHSCFLCKKLLSGKDIYMYKGDRAFCSEDCRCKHIFMDEEESMTPAKTGCTSAEYNSCSFSAVKPPQTVSGGGATTSSRSGRGKGPRNTSKIFAY